MYSQKYRPEWQRDSRMREWLKPVQGDSSKAFCKFCHMGISAKLQVLFSHAATKSHMKNANMLGKAPQQEAALHTFFNNCNDTKKETVALSLAVFICEHTSLNTANLLTNFFNKHAGTFIKMGRTKATNLIKNVLAPSYRRELVEALGKKPYSIIVDESTDVSSTKALGIIINYFNPSLGSTVNCFYRVAVSKVDATSLADAIFTCLREDGLNCDNIVGVGCDEASVMVGRHHSVSTLMREKIPHLITVRCVCHSLHLAASYAAGKLPSALEFLVSQTYSHFSRSTMRRDKYREIFREARGKDPLTFVRPANTRWLSLLEAITRIKDQWKQLQQYFRKVDNENSSSADDSYSVRTLRNMYEDDRNYLWVSFLEQYLRPIVRLNEAFQSKSADPIALLKDLEELYMTFLSYVASSEGIQQAKIHKNLFTFDYTPFLNESLTVFLGSEFHCLEFKCFPQEERSLARERGMYFLREVTDQLHKRLPDHTAMLPSFELLSPENVKRIDKFATTIDGIKNLAAQFSTVGISPKESCEEWMRVGLLDWNCKRTDLGTFWKEISEKAQDKQCFPNLSRLAAVLMALPISNAAVERMFSIMNIVKSKSRNRMAMNTCAAILEVRDAMRRNGVTCDTFVPTADMLKNFKSDILYPKSVEDGSDNDAGEPDDLVSQIALIEEEAILDTVRDAEARFNIHVNIV